MPALSERRPVWGVVALLAATATVSYISRTNISVAGALMMKELGLTQVQLGRVFSAFLLGYALFQVPSGMLADRMDPRKLLAAAALVWAATTVATPLVATSIAALLVVRFLLGVGEAPTFPAAGKAISDWVPAPLQGRANGVVMASIGLGSAVTPALITALMVTWGWRVAILVTAALPLVITASWSAASRHAPPEREVATAESPAVMVAPARDRLGSSSFLLLTASYTLQGYVGYIFVFWFYLYLVQERHFDLLRGAALSSLPWVLSTIAIPIGGWVSDALVKRWGLRWGRRAVPLVCFLASGLFLAFGATTANAYVAAVALAVSTACVLAVEGPFWATMIEICGRRSGTGGGIMNMGSNAGGFISPALTPWLAALFGWMNALMVAAALAIVAGLLWLKVDASAEQS